jgi:hypothetical protein
VPLWRLAAADTHLYPGARLRCLDQPGPSRFGAGDAVLVEFSDGNVVNGRIEEARPVEAVLSVEPHRTARCAVITGKRWRLAPGPEIGHLRVKARG